MATKKKAATRKRRVVKKRVIKYSPIKKTKMATKKRRRSRKPATATRRRRRSSISGVGNANMGSVLLIAGGAIAGKLVSAKLGAKMNPKILAGGQIAAGLFLPKMMKGNKMVAGIGTGLMVSGVLQLLSSFGILSGLAGMAGVDDIQLETMSGTDQLDFLAGDGDEMGYVDEGTMSGSDSLSFLAGGGDDWGEVLQGMGEDDALGEADDY